MRTVRFNKNQTIFLLLTIGIAFVFVRRIIAFLPASFLLEAIVYGAAGYILGNHIYFGRWRWGFLLALPAMIAILYFFMSINMETTTTNEGLENIVSFLLIPTSACAGIWLKNNRIIQHH
jgi:hypothetical protein